MGGGAFASGPDPLETPRMPKSIYERVRDRCHAALRDLFFVVASPIEGPAKTDHGDIDILVALPKPHAGPTTDDGNARPAGLLMDRIELALDAVRCIRSKGAGENTCHIAIVWPGDEDGAADAAGASMRGLMVEGALKGAHLAPLIPAPALLTSEETTMGTESPAAADNLAFLSPTDKGGDTAAGKTNTTTATAKTDDAKPSRRRHIQVDVRICASVAELQWMLFKHAHGDLWNMLGSTVRPFGLTADESALWLRVPEIERFDRGRAKVFLTADPAEALHFLGLRTGAGDDGGPWEAPFASLDDMCEYAASCRLFWVRPTAAADAAAAADETEPEGGPQLRSNDRRRLRQRPAFGHWQHEFVPRCRAQGRFAAPQPAPTRESVRGEAFARFPAAARAYAERLRGFRADESGRAARRALGECLPVGLDPARRGAVVGALRRLVLAGDAALGVVPDRPLRDADGVFDVAEVRAFVEARWREVLDRAWARDRAAFLEGGGGKRKLGPDGEDAEDAEDGKDVSPAGSGRSGAGVGLPDSGSGAVVVDESVLDGEGSDAGTGGGGSSDVVAGDAIANGGGMKKAWMDGV